MTRNRQRRALVRAATISISPVGKHPLNRPGAVPWVVVIILVITVMFGGWGPAEVLGLLTLLLALMRAVAGSGA